MQIGAGAVRGATVLGKHQNAAKYRWRAQRVLVGRVFEVAGGQFQIPANLR